MAAFLALLMAAAPSRPIVHATATDCRVIVAIGRAEAGWGLRGPDRPFAIDGDLPDGRVYREDCDWRALGVGAPRPATGRPGTTGFGIGRPAYSPDGLTATVAFDEVAVNADPRIGPFVSTRICTARKLRGRWRARGCRLQAIT